MSDRRGRWRRPSAGALGVGRVMASLVFGVSPTDALTYAVVAATLTLVAMIALRAE